MGRNVVETQRMIGPVFDDCLLSNPILYRAEECIEDFKMEGEQGGRERISSFAHIEAGRCVVAPVLTQGVKDRIEIA